MMRASLFAFAVVLAGCGGKTDDPFTADMKMACNAGRDDQGLPPDMRRVKAMRTIAEKIKTPEVARLMASLIQVAPSDRPELLAPALKRAGLSRCALFDDWQ